MESTDLHGFVGRSIEKKSILEYFSSRNENASLTHPMSGDELPAFLPLRR